MGGTEQEIVEGIRRRGKKDKVVDNIKNRRRYKHEDPGLTTRHILRGKSLLTTVLEETVEGIRRRRKNMNFTNYIKNWS